MFISLKVIIELMAYTKVPRIPNTWHLRSRVAELKDGDKNTQYFHHKASQTKKRNYIKGLVDTNSEWCDDNDIMEQIICEYYSSLLHFVFTKSG